MALWDVISHFGQLQFFVYLWMAITIVAWWKNDLTIRLLWMATFYVGLTVLLLVVAMYYRLVVIVDHGNLTGMTAAMATFVFLSYSGGMWTALAINKVALKQRGWLFTATTKRIRYVAAFLERNVDIVKMLRSAADNMEKKAEDCDPLRKIQQNLEIIQGHES
jgi:hypothetical protein